MFEFMMELITVAASNSLVVFGICNFIIVILLVSGSNCDSKTCGRKDVIHAVKRAEKEDEGEGHNAAVLVPQVNHERNGKQKKETEAVVYRIEASSAHDRTEDTFVNDDQSFVVIEENFSDEQEEDTNDELRRRAEEFIDKINRIWKEEKFGKSPYFQNENLHRSLSGIQVT